jgi:GR25 family glycosyltransferase involved in LPS biosynthesis
MRFNICHVRTNAFYRLYDDLIGALSASLSDLGHSCTIQRNDLAAGAVNILVGSTIFGSHYLSLPATLGGKPYIVYQLESLDDSHGLLSRWPDYWKVLQNAGAVWDYSPKGIEYLKAKGLSRVHHVPPGFHRSMVLERQARQPDIDVLFYGSPHPRRQRMIDALRARGLCVVNLDAAFGEERNRDILRSRIVLNMHAWDDLNSLETVRLSFLLANRAFVISEAADHNPYGDGVVYAPYEKLVECCLEYLGKSAAERERIAENGYSAVRKIDFVEIARATLARMGPRELADLALPPAPETDTTRRDAVAADVEIGKTPAPASAGDNVARIHLINLDRSPDRLAEFKSRNRHLRNVARFPAVDGSQLHRDELVRRGIIEPDLGYTAGALGNTLSHLALWDLALQTGEPVTLCEDDAVFHGTFEQKSADLLNTLPPQWHIVLWGYNFDSPVIVEWGETNSCTLTFDQDEIRRCLARFAELALQPALYKLAEGCGIVCYTISPAGAQILKNFCLPLRNMLIRFEGLNRTVPNFALDVMMNGIFRRMSAYACFPPLVVTPNNREASLTLDR